MIRMKNCVNCKVPGDYIVSQLDKCPNFKSIQGDKKDCT